MEIARIPDYREHDFSTGSYDAPGQQLFSLWQPSEFKVHRHGETRFVQDYDVTLDLLMLHFQYLPQSLRQSPLVSCLRF
jgi:hypothetical protein